MAVIKEDLRTPGKGCGGELGFKETLPRLQEVWKMLIWVLRALNQRLQGTKRVLWVLEASQSHCRGYKSWGGAKAVLL